MGAESCNKEKEALLEMKRELRNERFKWKMIALGVGVVAVLLLVSTLYFWWKSRDTAAAPGADTGLNTAKVASPEVASSVAATMGTLAEGESISPELR